MGSVLNSVYRGICEKLNVLSEGEAQWRSSTRYFDQLMKGYEKPGDLLGQDRLFMEPKKALVERALTEELTHHPGYSKGEKSSRNDGNTRNGQGKKKVKSSSGEMELAIPRDRKGGFEPQLIKKGQRHFDGFDDKIISMYARGMSTREIKGHFKELYGVEDLKAIYKA